MAGSALRLTACAGLLTTGLLMAAARAGIAVADTGYSAGGGTERASVTSKVEGGSGRESGATKPDHPTTTVGSGRDDIDIKSAVQDNSKNGNSADSKKPNGSITDPIQRIPRKDELPASGLLNPCFFYATLVKPVLTLADDVFAAMQPPPPPSPAPRAALRTQEAGPPVADSGGGGVDPVSTGVAAEPPVLQAPLVIAPLPIPIPLPPAVAPVAPPAVSAGVAPPPVAVEAVAVGANAPAIRGSLPPTVEPPAATLTPMSGQAMSGQATRLGYPRYLRTPGAGELAATALPGVAGLIFLTFSGGCIGYRQANSVRFLRAQDADRFLR